MIFELEKKIEQINWEFENCETQYLTHNIHRYSGKFIPQIAKTAIELLTEEGDILLDPYMGSGTTLLEAQLSKRFSIGIDLNPLAVLISKTKNLCLSDDASNYLRDYFIPNIDFMSDPEQAQLFFSDISIKNTEKEKWRLEDQWNRKWYQPSVLEKLVSIYEVISSIECEQAHLIALTSFSDILRKFSNASSKYPNVMFDKNAPIKVAPFKSYISVLTKNIEALIALRKEITPQTFAPQIIQGSNLQMPLSACSIDAIITHPPYIAAVPYAEYGALSLNWLGFSTKDIDEKLTGGKRHSKNVVDRFMDDYKKFFHECHTVLKSRKYMFLMVGNPTANGSVVDLLSASLEFAKIAGFSHIKTATRKGSNRRGNKMGEEYLLFFQKS